VAFDFPSNPAVNDVYNSGTATYTWNGYAWMVSSDASGGGTPADYVLKAGDTMTGPLVLPGDPTQPLQAATKAYVDAITALPPGGTAGQALVKNPANLPLWGAPIDGMNY